MLMALGFVVPTPALAPTVPSVQYSSSTAPLIIEAYAIHYGIPAEPLKRTLMCESKLRAGAVGDGGNSYGVAQIHLPSHPTITKEQALDPLFAIDWTAQQFAKGKQKMWSCYKTLYGGNSV